jgi:hypothetical protein
MRTILALLAVAAALAVAAPAGAMPIDAHGPIPSDTPPAAPVAAPASGHETWTLVAAAALAFAAGAAAARLVPVPRVRTP